MNKKKMWKRFFNLDRHHAEGFTLVELIVVIAILAILAGVAVPAYSGYITKANESADLQNLSMLNNMFVVACIANNEDPANVQSVTGKWADDGSKTLEGLASITWKAGEHPVIKEFNRSMGAPITFKSEITKEEILEGILNPDSVIGNSDTKAAYSQVLEKLLGTENAENLNKLMASIWGQQDAEFLTGKVDWTADIAEAMLSANPNGKFADLILNCGTDMLDYMGVKPEDYGAKLQELAVTKMEQLIKNNPEYANLNAADIFTKMNDENATEPSELEKQLYNEAQYSVSVNNAILAAAKNSSTASTNIKDILNKENPKTELINSVNAGVAKGDTGAAMGEVALAYAMYMSYAERNNIEVDGVDSVLEGLKDPGFKAYVNNTDDSETDDFTTDMNGYLASMNMIDNSVQGNEDAVTDVVLNGFGSNNLVDILNQAMNSTKK